MTIDELVTLIRYKTDDASVKQTETTSMNLANRIGGSFKSAIGGLAGMILPAAGIAGIGMIGYKAVTTAASIERLTAQYEVMLGSTAKAKTMIEDIQKTAATTPLTSLGISESVKQLLAFGVAGDKAIPTIRMLGDVAGGDQNRLNSLAYAYGQTMTAGRLMGQDLMQYMNQGFNPLKVIAENLDKFGIKAGTTQADLRKMMSQGQISAEMVTKAFQIATDAGGMFYKNMEKQSQTLGGLWSTMVDEIELAMVDFMKPFMGGLKDALKGMIQLAKSAGQMAQTVKEVALAFWEWKAVLIFIPPLLSMIYGATILGRIKEFIGSVKMLTSFQKMYTSTLSETGSRQVALGNAFRNLSTNAGGAWRGMIAGAKNFIGVMGMAQLAAASVFFAYERISAAKEKADLEVEQQTAVIRMQEIQGDLLDAKAGKLKTLSGKEFTSRKNYLDASIAVDDFNKLSKEERIRKLESEYEQARIEYENATRQLDPDAYMRMEEARIKAETEKLQAQTDKEMAALTKNSMTNVTNNVNNRINIPLTVDDKGNTQLSAMALDEAIRTAARSAFSIELIGVMEGV